MNGNIGHYFNESHSHNRVVFVVDSFLEFLANWLAEETGVVFPISVVQVGKGLDHLDTIGAIDEGEEDRDELAVEFEQGNHVLYFFLQELIIFLTFVRKYVFGKILFFF